MRRSHRYENESNRMSWIFNEVTLFCAFKISLHSENVLAMSKQFSYIFNSQRHLTVLSGCFRVSKVKIGENRENSHGVVAQFG